MMYMVLLLNMENIVDTVVAVRGFRNVMRIYVPILIVIFE